MGGPSPTLDRSGTSPSNDHGEFEADNIREAEGHKPAMMLLDQIGRRAWRRGAPVHWMHASSPARTRRPWAGPGGQHLYRL